jgi:hypothetical protein
MLQPERPRWGLSRSHGDESETGYSGNWQSFFAPLLFGFPLHRRLLPDSCS